jgi:hypothetical protein
VRDLRIFPIVNRGNFRFLACVSALLAFAVVAAPASAKVHHHGGFSYVSKGFKLGRKSLGRHQLACPKGTHVYGGGISAKAAFGKLHQLQSYPVDTKDANKDPDDAWGVLVSNGGKRIRARMFATCGTIEPTFVKYHKALFGNETLNETDSECPSNVLGGGVRGSKGLVFEDGGPVDSVTWYSYARNTSPKSGSFTQYAICAGIAMAYTQNGGQQQPMSVISHRAECPDGTSVISGGSSTGGSVNTTTSAPFGTYKGWLFRGDFVGNFQNSTDSLAACAVNQN